MIFSATILAFLTPIPAFLVDSGLLIGPHESGRSEFLPEFQG